MNSFLNILTESVDETSKISWSNTIDGQIVEWFNELGIWGNFALIVISLLIATLFGGIIGYQREVNGHAAGFRTHILIALGSAVIMILSIYGISNTGTRDPMRFAAAGVTGIGFLGAGSIIQNGFNIKGLTTAASIWITMAIGMACGAGYFVIGSVATIVTVLCLGFFGRIEKSVNKKNSNIMVIVKQNVAILGTIMNVSDKLDILVKDINSSTVSQSGETYLRVVFRVACKDEAKVQKLIGEIFEEVHPVEIKLLH